MPFDPQQLATLQAIAFDVDGVLTDGTLIWSAAGDESKRFSFTDIMGISLLRRLDLKMALISGEPSPPGRPLRREDAHPLRGERHARQGHGIARFHHAVRHPP